MSILASVTLPFWSATTRSITGPSVLHGPHHGAQKSTITGRSREASTTSAMKDCVVTSLTAGAAAGAGEGAPPRSSGGAVAPPTFMEPPIEKLLSDMETPGT